MLLLKKKLNNGEAIELVIVFKFKKLVKSDIIAFEKVECKLYFK